jgi:hypothetical protein
MRFGMHARRSAGLDVGISLQKIYENTREFRPRNASACTARLSTIFSSRRTHIVTLFSTLFEQPHCGYRN